MTTTRRSFLKALAGVGTGILFSNPVDSRPSLILKRKIPSSGEEITAIGLGTYRSFDVGDNAEKRIQLAKVLVKFVDFGGQVVDSSPMYGTSEKVVGDVAQQINVQKKLFYATKVWTDGKQQGIEEMERSMRLMRTDKMDLMQIHNLVDWETHIKTLYDWKEKGRVRYIGITHYTNSAFDDLAEVMKSEKIDFVQLPYNIINTQAEQHILPLAQDKGIGVIPNRPFQQGRLFRAVKGKELPLWAADFDCKSWAQFFLKFILSHPAVTCPIPATSKPKHLIDNMQAGFGNLPDKKTRKKMADYLKKLI